MSKIEFTTERLSAKYDMKYSKVYDLISYIEIKLIRDKPREFLINRKEVYEKSFNIAERYLRIKQYRDK
ncbi:MAG: hypothetical protein ACP5N1_06305 [Candidatus Woesearchaeota archaeon]